MIRFLLTASLLFVTPFSFAAPAPQVRVDLVGTWIYRLPHPGELALALHRDGSYEERFNRPGAPIVKGFWTFRDNTLYIRQDGSRDAWTFRIHARSDKDRLYVSWQAPKSTYWTRGEMIREGSPIVPAPKKVAVDPLLDALNLELQRLPSEEVCKYWRDFATRHQQWVAQRAILYTWEKEIWWAYYRQIRECEHVWDNLYSAHSAAYNGISYRWKCLDEVRAAIGELAYAEGFLWPPVAGHMLPGAD